MNEARPLGSSILNFKELPQTLKFRQDNTQAQKFKDSLVALMVPYLEQTTAEMVSNGHKGL